MFRSPFRTLVLTCAALSIGVTGCGGGDDGPSGPPASNARNVKYEITGNFSGALTVVHTAESNATVVKEVTALPWSLSITFPSSVAGIGIAGNSVLGRGGVAGQTATLRIYSGGTLVKSQDAVTLSNGSISLPALAFVFP